MMRSGLFRALSALTLAAALPVAARQPESAAAGAIFVEAQPAPQVCPADDSAAGPGLRAFIDPQTGQLRAPTPEEARALAAAVRADLARAIESLEPIVHDDGMISLDLQGLFMQNLVAVRAADGSLSMGCVEGPPTTATFFPPEAPKPAPGLEER